MMTFCLSLRAQQPDLQNVQAIPIPFSCATPAGNLDPDWQEDLNFTPDASAPCTSPEAIKYVRVAIHFMLREHKDHTTVIEDCGNPKPYPIVHPISWGNFTPFDDGLGGSYNGYKRARDIIVKANEELATMAETWRKEPGQDYPKTPTKYRYVLQGVYFHYNNLEYAPTSFSKVTLIHQKYDVDGANVIDAYVTRSYLDGSGEASSIGANYNGAILNKYLVMDGYGAYLKSGCRDWSLEYQASTLNHEIGHSLGLWHTWQSDGLIDTKEGQLYSDDFPTCSDPFTRANCWKHFDILPNDRCPDYPCAGPDWSGVSNNLMDYNQWFPHALTPMQIKVTNKTLGTTDGSSYVYDCGEFMPAISFFELPAVLRLCGESRFWSVPLNAQGSFNSDQYEIEICELDAAGACISTFSTGWVTETISDKKKLNLAKIYTFNPNKKYKVTLKVKNSSNSLVSTSSKNIELLNCDFVGNTPIVPCCVTINALNPFDGTITGNYHVDYDARTSVHLINTVTGQTYEVQNEQDTQEGIHYFDYTTDNLSDGLYILMVVFDGYPYYKSVLKESN
jgi:hypothetical protein